MLLEEWRPGLTLDTVTADDADSAAAELLHSCGQSALGDNGRACVLER